MHRFIFTLLILVLMMACASGAIRLKHHYGQTFVVFERGATTTDSFLVYRSTSAIDAGNYQSATLLARLPYDCYFGICLLGGYSGRTINNYVIDSMGQELAADTGMFCHTCKEAGTHHYGVVRLTGGNGVFLGSASIAETQNTITVPVFVHDDRFYPASRAGQTPSPTCSAADAMGLRTSINPSAMAVATCLIAVDMLPVSHIQSTSCVFRLNNERCCHRTPRPLSRKRPAAAPRRLASEPEA